jgi:DNA polymerase (family X)
VTDQNVWLGVLEKLRRNMSLSRETPKITPKRGLWRSVKRWRFLRERYRLKSDKASKPHFQLSHALRVADQLLAELAVHEAVVNCSCGGSVRRMEALVGDIDLIAASKHPDDAIAAFLSCGRIRQIGRIRKRRGWSKSVRGHTPDGVPVELLVVPPEYYAAALITSSGDGHAMEICKRALQKIYGGLRGLLRYLRLQPLKIEKVEIVVHLLRTARVDKIEGTEEEIYEALSMQWIHPTLRRGKSEFKAALQRRIPRLVELCEIRGDLHWLWPPANEDMNIWRL